MTIRFQNIEVKSKSLIGYQFTLDESGLGILKFNGKYLKGSAGNNDGDFMIQITDSVLKHEGLNRLLVDLRELEYEWGNTIFNMIFDLKRSKLKVAIVYSDKCKEIVSDIDNFFFNDPIMAFNKLNK
jgi:hypothetical protein